MSADMDWRRKFVEARREVLEVLREAFPDRHDELWETLVRGMIKEAIAITNGESTAEELVSRAIAENVIEENHREPGRCGNPDCNLCREERDIARGRTNGHDEEE